MWSTGRSLSVSSGASVGVGVGVEAGAGVAVALGEGEGAGAVADPLADEAPAGMFEDPPQATQAHSAVAARPVRIAPGLIATFELRIKGETLSRPAASVKRTPRVSRLDRSITVQGPYWSSWPRISRKALATRSRNRSERASLVISSDIWSTARIVARDGDRRQPINSEWFTQDVRSIGHTGQGRRSRGRRVSATRSSGSPRPPACGSPSGVERGRGE